MILLLFFLPFFLFSANYTHFIDSESEVHVLQVDPAQHRLELVRAQDQGLGRESVLSIAARTNALAAISGGFFTVGTTFDGRSAGALKIHNWISLPVKLRAAIGWSQEAKIDLFFAELQTNYGPLNGFNRPRLPTEAILYTPAFHRTTLTAPDGQELLIQNGVITAIQNGGSTPIPLDGAVLSLHREHPLFDTLHLGDPFTYSIASSPEWDYFDYILGGAPLLVHNGTVITDFSIEKTPLPFLFEKHARVALGITAEGEWLLVVVDHNLVSKGMTIPELAALMARLGAIDALNLGGGKASTLVLEGKVMNMPSGEEKEGSDFVRRVSDAIIVR